MINRFVGVGIFLLGISLFDRGSGFLTQTGFANSEHYHGLGVELITLSAVFIGLAIILWREFDES